MDTFVIGQIMNEYNDKVIGVRLIDISTKNTTDIGMEEFMSIIKEDKEAYRDSNIWGIYLDEDDIRGDYFSTFLYELTQDYEDDSCDSLLALKKLNNGKYIVTDVDGNIKYIKEKDLYKYDIVNIEIDTEDKELRNFVLIAVNVVNEPQKHTNSKKEIEIRNEYNAFISKSKLFGVNNNFEYKIEGNEVVLTNYNGTNTEPTVPNFITKIGNGAFATHWRLYDKYKLKKVYLHEGLVEIDNYAFALSDIKEIVIPSTVKIIRRGAFNSSYLIEGHIKGEIDRSNNLDMSRIKLLNKDTVLEDLLKKNIKN